MNLKTQYIRALYSQKAFLIQAEPFTLHHGGTSHIYMNHSQFLSKHENIQLLVQMYAEMLPQTPYTLGAVDSIVSPILCGMLASSLHKDIVVIKEKKLEHGVQNQIYGNTEHEVILIDDVTSTGTILVNATQALRDKNIPVNTAFVSACRDLTAIQNLQKINVTTHYIATYEDIITTLWPKLSPTEKAIVHQEINEKNYSWQLPK